MNTEPMTKLLTREEIRNRRAPTKKRYPRTVCVHEAGHAVAAADFLGGFAYVQVFDEPMDGQDGICHYPDDEGTPLMRAIYKIAGPMAEARSRRICRGMSLQPAMLAAHCGGSGDLSEAAAICQEAGLDQREALREAHQYIRRTWPRISALADLLQRRGLLTWRDYTCAA